MNLILTAVPLTPQQHRELEDADPELVDAWVAAYLQAPASIKNPVGWFVNGVRSGEPPYVGGADHDEERRARRLRLAEIRMANIGPHLIDEDDVRAEFFGDRAQLEGREAELLTRFLELWRAERPRGLAHAAEHSDWAARWKGNGH